MFVKYKEFICWSYGKLGQGKQKGISSCVVNRIGENSPLLMVTT